MGDEEIDASTKWLLKIRKNGQYIPVDIVAHFEYFYNTLMFSHQTENPFLNPPQYPALLFKEAMTEGTLFDRHRHIIFPSSAPEAKGGSTLSITSPPAKYGWYPNN